MFYTVGIDVGCSAIKSALMSFDDDGENEQLIGVNLIKIRRQNIKDVIEKSFNELLLLKGLAKSDIAYIATTGDGELVDFRKGHFYSMTTHARGALFLNPGTLGLIDAGALHAKVILIDNRAKVLNYRMTSQCASGSGQFLENISRYLGIALEDVGKLSIQADKPEVVSSICAVLAETDVINMVSRNISINNILKGIHLSMAHRLIALLREIKGRGPIMVTGGLANDKGFVAALQELGDKDNMGATFLAHEHSAQAGSIGAAIWGGFRHVKLIQTGRVKAAS